MEADYVACLDKDGQLSQAYLMKNKVKHWQWWQSKLVYTSDLIGDFGLMPDTSGDLELPALSFVVSFPFQLEKPYISKDDRSFYIFDNPLRRERVFQVPMVASTGWKGAFRASLWQLGYEDSQGATVRLLGNPRESEEGQRGRLYFFPTFFKGIDLEVINPHSRNSGVGAKGPIHFECVPARATGLLLLLYVPFGSAATSSLECAEVAQDLEIVTSGLQAMLKTYGFGAKTSSGFGTAFDRLPGVGKLILRADLAVIEESETTPDAPTTALARYLVSPWQLHPDFCKKDGSLKTEGEYQKLIEGRGQKYARKDRQLYAKAKSWFEREGKQLLDEVMHEADASVEPTPATVRLATEWEFTSLTQFAKIAKNVADELRKEGEG